MRCRSCNVALSDREATRKSRVTKEYLDMCDKCLIPIAEDVLPVVEESDNLWDEIDESVLFDLPNSDHEEH